ncbi:hypothetical protein [Massilia sp. CCM 8734]|uniref:hypothetical protein n=1 Tax=Massilia sp. CCM 8734 TaxID=2609283 RepID=UPI001420DD6C|nr:hypothetical protein [Massilia sp. CCM 8734]NHZ96619.1 hypothetical protein [Massilia sp. CCM 8734]
MTILANNDTPMGTLTTGFAHRRALGMVATVLLCACLIPAAHAKKCTEKQADAFEAMVDHLDSWEKVDQLRKQYGHCDDGGPAELLSEAIALQLADRWESLPELAKLIERDRALKPFVLRHVNSTLNDREVNRIQVQATSSCPAGLKGLCAELKKRAADAFK